MKITDVSVFQLQGVMEHAGDFWEERLVRPVDVYPEHKLEGTAWMGQVAPDKYRITAYFVEIRTDDGVTGLGRDLDAGRPAPVEHLEREVQPGGGGGR